MVTVDVEMEITASSKTEAAALFEKHVIMTAGMADLDDNDFFAIEDSISEIGRIQVEDAE
jgi:hypothetical protein